MREVELPVEERETVDGCLRQIEFLDQEVAATERAIAQAALDSPEVRRLMTVPGVNVIVAATFLAAVGDISRFPSQRQLAGYLGLDPRVRQSGMLTRGQDYAFGQPSLTRKKLRRLELQAVAAKGAGGTGVWATNGAMRQAERELAHQAEVAYQRTVSDWQATTPAKTGASATPGRASQRPSKGKQRDRASVPNPAL